jgi:hypothetical protein
VGINVCSLSPSHSLTSSSHPSIPLAHCNFTLDCTCLLDGIARWSLAALTVIHRKLSKEPDFFRIGSTSNSINCYYFFFKILFFLISIIHWRCYMEHCAGHISELYFFCAAKNISIIGQSILFSPPFYALPPPPPLTSRLSPLASRLSPLASRLSPLASRLSPLASRLSPLASFSALIICYFNPHVGKDCMCGRQLFNGWSSTAPSSKVKIPFFC